MAAIVGLLTSGALASAGCIATETCTEDWQCADAQLNPGLCVDDGRTGRYCVVPSPACPSGWRWQENAEDSIRQTCVLPALVARDGGADGGARD